MKEGGFVHTVFLPFSFFLFLSLSSLWCRILIDDDEKMRRSLKNMDTMDTLKKSKKKLN